MVCPAVAVLTFLAVFGLEGFLKGDKRPVSMESRMLKVFLKYFVNKLEILYQKSSSMDF